MGWQGEWSGEKKKNFSFLRLERLRDTMNCIWGRRILQKRTIDNSIGLLNRDGWDGWRLSLSMSYERQMLDKKLGHLSSPEWTLLEVFSQKPGPHLPLCPVGYLQLKQVIFGMLRTESYFFKKGILPPSAATEAYREALYLMSNQKGPIWIFQFDKDGEGTHPDLDTCMPNDDVSLSKLLIYNFIKCCCGKKKTLIKHFISWLI